MSHAKIFIVRPSNTLSVILEDTSEPAQELAFLSLQAAEEYLSDLTARADLFGVYHDAEDLDFGGSSLDRSTLYLFSNNRQIARTIARIETVKLGG